MSVFISADVIRNYDRGPSTPQPPKAPSALYPASPTTRMILSPIST